MGGVTTDSNGCKYMVKSVEYFKLNDVYSEHKQVVQDMVDTAQEYNKTFVDSISDMFKKTFRGTWK